MTKFRSSDNLFDLDGTGALQVPSGTTGERPGSPADGQVRFNTTLNDLEVFLSSAWTIITVGAVLIQNKLDATAPPDATNDSSEGYSIGSFWIDITADEAYRCLDATDDAAVWINTTLTISELGTAAIKDIGTSGNDVPLLDGVNTWSGTQTWNVSPFITSTTLQPFNIKRTDEHGSAITLGRFSYIGRNSTPADFTYGLIDFLVIDESVGTEDSRLDFATAVAGTLAARFQIEAGIFTPGATGGDKGVDTLNISTLYLDGTDILAKANTWTAAQIFTSQFIKHQYSDNDEAIGPLFDLERISTSPAGSDIIGTIRFVGRDSDDNTEPYAEIRGFIDDPTAASEDGHLEIFTVIAGAYAARVNFGNGMWTVGAGGGDQGADTINTSQLFLDGTDIFAKINTWTGVQTFPHATDITRDGFSSEFFISRTDTHGSADIAEIAFRGVDASDNVEKYIRFIAYANDDTVDSEDGRMDFQSLVAGTDSVRWSYAQGIWTVGATGGDKGVDTINATTIYEDGVPISPIGKQTIWIPATAMTPTFSDGCSILTSVETTADRPDMNILDFNDTVDEHAQFEVAFPKSWALGTVTFQAFWTTATAVTTGIAIGLQGVAVSDNTTVDVVYGSPIVVIDDAQGAAEELYVTVESGAITIDGTPADDDVCYFRIFRDVSDANDDMLGDMRLIGIKLFFTTDAGNDI